jgi:methionine-rich copper-binding protein CopC
MVTVIFRRLAAVLLLSGIAVVATATPAFAHAELIGSNPAEDATLSTPPQQIELTFNEPVTLGANPVTVTGPGGASWTVGAPVADGAVVVAPVQASGPAGTYSVIYEMVSKDGDTVRGAVTFTLTAAAAPPPTTTTTTTTATTTAAPTGPSTTAEPPPATTPVAPAADESTDDGGLPAWVWVLAAVVVLAVVVVVVLRLRRAKQS